MATRTIVAGFARSFTNDNIIAAQELRVGSTYAIENQLNAVVKDQSPTSGGAKLTVTESKGLKTGDLVYWRGDAADSGTIAETSWDSVTIA